MCGIIAWKNFSDHDEKHIQKALHAISHRGPDGLHSWTASESKTFLGHARLSIIDLNTGDQPITDDSTGNVIIFNGEIYNYPELREELISLGHSFKTKSDTEVVLKGFIQFGSYILKKMNGMFAFIIFDPKKDELFFARDPVGIKPLYFSEESGGILLGSELRSLAKLKKKPCRLSHEGIIQYIHQGYTIAPLTLLEGISQLPHSHFGTWSHTKGLHIERYYDFSSALLEKSRSYVDQKSALQELDTVLSRVVKRQLIADVPVGCFLSGGIDSSLTTYYAKQFMQEELHTFTADFDLKEYSEAALAREISTTLGTQHHIFEINSNELQKEWSEFAWQTDAPLFDNSFLALSSLSRETRKHVKVVLSGDGGDEAFLGYETYRADWLHRYTNSLPNFSKKALASMAELIPVRFGKVSTSYKLHAFLRSFQNNSSHAHANWRSLSSEEGARSLLVPQLKPLFEEFHPARIYEKLFQRVEGADFLSAMSYLDFETWLPNDILVKSDRASMAHGLEARVPLLDIELVEFAMSLPDRLKFAPNMPKSLLRNLLAQKIPTYPIHEKKKGFNVPMSEWICDSLSNEIKEILKSNSQVWDVIDRTRFSEMLELHLKRKKDYGYLIWAVVVLHEWFNRLTQEN